MSPGLIAVLVVAGIIVLLAIILIIWIWATYKQC